MRSSQDQSNIIIYKAMALGVATAELQKKIGNRDYVWLLRESREPGMLTVQSLTKNKTAKAHRYCLTKDGWKDASTKELIAALKPSMIEVKISNIEEVARQHIDSLFDVIATSYGLKNENLVLPSAAMQSNQSMYSCYIVSDHDDISEDVPSVSRSNAGLFNSSSQKRKGNTDVTDKDLLALIVDPITQKIMSHPVTFSDGTMCDLSSVGPKHKEGVDFIRNRTMENVIKYINVIFSDDIAKVN